VFAQTRVAMCVPGQARLCFHVAPAVRSERPKLVFVSDSFGRLAVKLHHNQSEGKLAEAAVLVHSLVPLVPSVVPKVGLSEWLHETLVLERAQRPGRLQLHRLLHVGVVAVDDRRRSAGGRLATRRGGRRARVVELPRSIGLSGPAPGEHEAGQSHGHCRHPDDHNGDVGE
jgi:hypothetical protein